MKRSLIRNIPKGIVNGVRPISYFTRPEKKTDIASKRIQKHPNTNTNDELRRFEERYLELKGTDGKETEYFRMVLQAYKLLTSKPFLISAFELNKMYDESDHVFLVDLLQYPRINEEIIELVFGNLSRSSELRALIFQDLFRMIKDGNQKLVLDTFQIMSHYKILRSDQVIEDTIPALAKRLILEVAFHGEALLATTYLLHFKDTVDHDTLLPVLKALTMSSDSHHIYNAYAIMKLVDAFSIENFSVEGATIALQYLSSKPVSLYFSNIFYNRLKESGHSDISEFSHPARDLILLNLNAGGYELALNIFLDTYNGKESRDAMDIAVTLIRELKNEETLVQILSKVNINNDQIVDILLKKFGSIKYQSQFNKLVKQLSPPLRRLTLSLLFQGFLYQNNETAAESILESIFKSKNGLTSDDFDIIIEKLLLQDKTDQSITMAGTTDINVAKYAYVRIFKKIVGEETNLKSRAAFFKEICVRFRKLHRDDDALVRLTTEIIRFMTMVVSTRAARKYFMQINRYTSKSDAFTEDKVNMQFNLDQFLLPNSLKYLLALSDKSRLDCLELIVEQAVVEEDVDVIIWGVEELRLLGFQVNDIILKLRSKENGKLIDSILNESVLSHVNSDL